MTSDDAHDITVLRQHDEAGSPMQGPAATLARIGEVDISIQSAIVQLHIERRRDAMAITTSGPVQ
jgi:hypothetical protein